MTMMETFTATFSTMLILLFCITAGFLVGKAKILPENTDSVLSKCETFIFCPAMVLNNLMTNCTVEGLKSQASCVGYSALVTIIGVFIGIPLAILMEKKGYQRNIWKYAMAFPNYGFLGLAIVPLILGEEAVFGYVMFMLPLNIGVYTYGTALLLKNGEDDGDAPKKGAMFRRLLNPMIISMLIGMFLGLTGIGAVLPKFVHTAISSLNNCFSPVAMVLTGFVISKFGLKKLFSVKKSYVASTLRLLLLPAFFLTLCYLLKASRDALMYTLLAMAAPIGLNTIVFPASCGEDTSTGASMAVISHLACVVTIPLLYACMVGLGWV